MTTIFIIELIVTFLLTFFFACKIKGHKLPKWLAILFIAPALISIFTLRKIFESPNASISGADISFYSFMVLGWIMFSILMARISHKN